MNALVESKKLISQTEENQIQAVNNLTRMNSFDTSYDYIAKRKRDATNRAGDLKRNSGEKSHLCNICDYGFVRAGNFRTNLKIHPGEKS